MLFAYLLVNINNKSPVYAGQGTWKRITNHCRPSGCRRFNQTVIIGLSISCVSRQEALDIEKELISKYNPPFNKARWSTFGGIKLSPERCKQISLMKRGSIISPEHREILRQAHLGSKHTIETRHKMSETRKGMIKSPETRAKIGNANRGHKHDAQARQKMVEAWRRRRGEII